LKKILAAFLDPETDSLSNLAALVDVIRPGTGKTGTVNDRLDRLVVLLEERPDWRDGLRQALLQLFTRRHAVLLFATSGIYPETGVFTELRRRVNQKLLPEADDNIQLKHAIRRIFQRSDAHWLEAVPAELSARLINSLHIHTVSNSGGMHRILEDLLEALRVVAHRIAAAGLEPEMLSLDPALENHASPFMALCEEALALVHTLKGNGGMADALQEIDERHLLVLVAQSRETIVRLRRRAQQLGASLHLTFHLCRLSQHLDRLEQLMAIAAAIGRSDSATVLKQADHLWRELVLAECRRNDLRSFWQKNTELVALRVTENAGKSGERYITENRSDFYAMLASAAGGGFVIAFMAANKIFLETLGLPPLVEVLAFCLNYGLGFVFIHILHFTVATKQPAMTANAIAAVIGEAEDTRRGRQRDIEPLVTLVARTVRTQLVAILGNIGLAVPVAMLFAYGLYELTGGHFIDPEKARLLLNDINPLGSAALIFAAIAGICLFLAGLIAGYYDNMCAYNRIPERLYQLRWLQRLFGIQRWRRITDYIGNNLGALAGNFFFGFLLGGVSGLGMLLGLPLDIRHIAFSSAYWGYAMVGLEFSVEWQLAALAAVGVLLIGLTNLVVSFYLAMSVGLKARGVTISQRMALVRAIGKRLLTHPRQFFLPPTKAGDNPEITMK
jgi:site-specific recombinase